MRKYRAEQYWDTALSCQDVRSFLRFCRRIEGIEFWRRLRWHARRVEVSVPDELAIVHAMNRGVRRCFLLGNDPVTGKNDDHRKEWVEQLLKQFAAHFGIDLLAFAILSNQFPQRREKAVLAEISLSACVTTIQVGGMNNE